jgi:ferritin
MRYLKPISEEIDLGEIKVPAKDWESTQESIKLVLVLWLEERKQMKLKIESLKEKLNKNSRNFSIPSNPQFETLSGYIDPLNCRILVPCN